MSEAIVKIDKIDCLQEAANRPSPRELISQATEEANVLAEVIEGQKLYATISGRRFVRCEGWTTLATLRGCLPREVSVTEMSEGRYVAEVELIRISDGFVLTRASAECGGPEDPVWMKRPPNARRSMAITRATGKACRVAFSWVMALSGFEVTPLEEMPETLDAEIVHPRSAPKSENAGVREAAATAASDLGDFVLTFGKEKGKKISQVDSGYLHFLLETTEKNLNDPEKAKFRAQDEARMTSLLREKQRRAQNAMPDAPLNDPEDVF
jgi:hypothetical protein